MLAEMEQALAAEDPKLVSTLTDLSEKPAVKKGLAISVGLILLGVIGLFAGLFTKQPIIGVVGFAIALVGAVATLPKFSSLELKGKKSRVKGRSRIEDRWNRRNFN